MLGCCFPLRGFLGPEIPLPPGERVPGPQEFQNGNNWNTLILLE